VTISCLTTGNSQKTLLNKCAGVQSVFENKSNIIELWLPDLYVSKSAGLT